MLARAIGLTLNQINEPAFWKTLLKSLLLSVPLFVLIIWLGLEGIAAIPETGGAATFTRRAFNDLAGFTTGWVLFLDFLTTFLYFIVSIPKRRLITTIPRKIRRGTATSRPRRNKIHIVVFRKLDK